ncbi:MAG: helix-turn-helix domain-containing protein [Patescibacteria group bacterium]|nr:helix-turn-helix domain-containing protein [Patescibacteria group bacterium]
MPDQPTIKVIPANYAAALNWAKNRCDLDADAIRRQFPQLQSWIDGTVEPKMNELRNFSDACDFPFGFLVMKEPFVEKETFGKKLHDARKKLGLSIDEVVAACNRKVDHICDAAYIRNLERDRVDVEDSPTIRLLANILAFDYELWLLEEGVIPDSLRNILCDRPALMLRLIRGAANIEDQKLEHFCQFMEAVTQ